MDTRCKYTCQADKDKSISTDGQIAQKNRSYAVSVFILKEKYMSDQVLEGKVAIVTGAAQGLGASYARALAAEGASVAIADKDSGLAVVEDIKNTGGQALDIPTDVSDEDATRDMVAKTIKEFGKLDILINNAAIFTAVERKKFDEISVEEWDRMHAVNVRGTWLCCKAAIPEMRNRGYGKIINIATSRIFQGVPFF